MGAALKEEHKVSSGMVTAASSLDDCALSSSSMVPVSGCINKDENKDGFPGGPAQAVRACSIACE